MKLPLLVLASALAAPLCFSTITADDVTSWPFHALGGLSDSAHLVAMTNDQLAVVEAGASATDESVGVVNRPNNAVGKCAGVQNCISREATNRGGTQNAGGVLQRNGKGIPNKTTASENNQASVLKYLRNFF